MNQLSYTVHSSGTQTLKVLNTAGTNLLKGFINWLLGVTISIFYLLGYDLLVIHHEQTPTPNKY